LLPPSTISFAAHCADHLCEFGAEAAGGGKSLARGLSVLRRHTPLEFANGRLFASPIECTARA
jgi:hypothetical protein